MERAISQEERIRRAEEIYSRRRYENRNNYYVNSRARYDNRPTEIKSKMLRKMIIQILVCTAIYLLIYGMQHSNQIFSTDVINKAKEILAYDISVQSLYDKYTEYFKNLQKENEQLNNEMQNEEQQDTENIEGDIGENVEANIDNNADENNTEITDSNIEENENVAVQEAVGGPEEVAEVEKSQEELDIEYVKQNANIIWPLTGVITSRFGKRTPTEIVSANHYGIDIAGDIGDDIICAVDGIVTISSSEGDYGKHIKVENGEIATLYAHCSKLLVNEGDTVKQGEKIAEVGETGRATGPHLHFEIKREGRFINPEEILGNM